MSTKVHPPGVRTLALVALASLVPTTAKAQYLDPGAGRFSIQILIALVVGVSVAIKAYWGHISEFFARRKKEKSER